MFWAQATLSFHKQSASLGWISRQLQPLPQIVIVLQIRFRYDMTCIFRFRHMKYRILVFSASLVISRRFRLWKKRL